MKKRHRRYRRHDMAKCESTNHAKCISFHFYYYFYLYLYINICIFIYIFMSINSQFYSFTSLDFGSSRDNFKMKNEKFNAIRWLLIF